ncbi:MAG: aminotransferase class V-fold PLP-dependent enzyme [Chloroflexi bacterium]|nr:aminotransferase class V-fold PLP-dependent enzyme [Chloroflexota bacterium]
MHANDELDLASLRREFPITERWAYFDHATYGPHPRAYVQTLADVAQQLSADVLGATSAGLEEVRASAARLLHAPVEQVALLRSTGEATNLVASGVDWQPGDEVILYELDFPSLIAPWLAVADRGVQVRVVRDEGRNRFELEDFVELMTPRTRAVSVSLVNNTTGFRAPVEALAAECAARNIWLTVDAVQAVGSMDVDAPSLGGDVVAAHSYKFLLSGFGQALVYCSDRAKRELRVPHVGLRNMRMDPNGTLFDSGLNLFDSARRFEPSVPNLAANLAMGAAINLLLETGPRRIEAHNRQLCARLCDGLQEMGYTLITSQAEGESAGLVCAVKDGVASDSIQERLAAAHMMSAVRGGNLRFAPHLYNTEAEVDQLISALREPVRA